MSDVHDLDAARQEQVTRIDEQLRVLRGALTQALDQADPRAQERATSEMTRLLDQRGRLLPRKLGRKHASTDVQDMRTEIAAWIGRGYPYAAVVAMVRERFDLGPDHAGEEVRTVRALVRDSTTPEAITSLVSVAYQTSFAGLLEMARDRDLEPALRIQALRSLAHVGQSLLRSAGGMAVLRAEIEPEQGPYAQASTDDLLAQLAELRGAG